MENKYKIIFGGVIMVIMILFITMFALSDSCVNTLFLLCAIFLVFLYPGAITTNLIDKDNRVLFFIFNILFWFLIGMLLTWLFLKIKNKLGRKR